MRNGFGSMCFGLILVQGLFSVGLGLFRVGLRLHYVDLRVDLGLV